MSRIPGPINHDHATAGIPARTPGTLGIADAADPDAHAQRGDTPGALGHNDHGSPDHGAVRGLGHSAQPHRHHHHHHRHHAKPSGRFRPVSSKVLRARMKRNADREQGNSISTMIDAKGEVLRLEEREGIAAQVYFATDETTLDSNDLAALIKVYNYYAALLFKPQLRRIPPKVTLRVVGHADYRGTEAHNAKLAEKRARAVARLFSPLSKSSQFSISASGVGASEQPQPVSSSGGPVSRQLNQFRRVDVFARPFLSKHPRPPVHRPPPPQVGDEWAIRIIGAAGATTEASNFIKPIAKRLKDEAMKEAAKVILEQLEKHLHALAIGYNAVVIEIIDVDNLVGMLYMIEGVSFAVGVDITFTSEPSKWQTARTTKRIRIKDFEGYGRHMGLAVGFIKSSGTDALRLYGPEHQGAEAVYVEFWGFWDGSFARPTFLFHGKFGWAVDIEPLCKVRPLAGPYPITPDYVSNEDESESQEKEKPEPERRPQELPDPPDISDLVKRT